MLTNELKSLSRSEKLLLINDLWDDVAKGGDEFPLSPKQEAMLDERYRDFLENPEQGKPWGEVKEELKRR